MVSSEEDDVKHGDTIQWDVNMEVQLFYAMANHKPVGINKHFQMACIREKLSNSIAKEISTQDIWKHLESLYDLSMLVDTEPIPFPNHQVLFILPESEFGVLMKQKCKEIAVADDNEDDRSPSFKSSTSRSSSRGTASKDITPKGIRKDSIGTTKIRKESGSSHASTDTPSIKSEKDYDRRRDSRDSNASGPKESSSVRKSISQRDKISKPKISSTTSEENVARRGRRRTNTSTPPATTPAKRRRT